MSAKIIVSKSRFGAKFPALKTTPEPEGEPSSPGLPLDWGKETLELLREGQAAELLRLGNANPLLQPVVTMPKHEGIVAGQLLLQHQAERMIGLGPTVRIADAPHRIETYKVSWPSVYQDHHPANVEKSRPLIAEHEMIQFEEAVAARSSYAHSLSAEVAAAKDKLREIEEENVWLRRRVAELEALRHAHEARQGLIDTLGL